MPARVEDARRLSFAARRNEPEGGNAARKRKERRRGCSFLLRSSRGVSGSRRNFSTGDSPLFFSPAPFALFTRRRNSRHVEAAGFLALRPETSCIGVSGGKATKIA